MEWDQAQGKRRKRSRHGAIDEVKVKAPLVCWCAPYLYTSESGKKKQSESELVWSGLPAAA